jgi:hypothetical protein
LSVLLVDNGMQVHQIRLEDSQPAFQLLDLGLEFAFYVGSLA